MIKKTEPLTKAKNNSLRECGGLYNVLQYSEDVNTNILPIQIYLKEQPLE